MIKLNPYPFKHRFAFTVIHDADSAYSKRLQPLVDVFTALQMPITLTVFTLWADWARNGDVWSLWNGFDEEGRYTEPVAIPLEDPVERYFYEKVYEQGYEIAMHTASETSDTRERVASAFEYYKGVFREYPRMYVEHSNKSKLDAQVNEGSRPGSRYFNTDFLNERGCWTWPDYEESICGVKGSSHDILSACGTLFDSEARQRFGLKRAFYRSGNWDDADGPGFLRCYNLTNIESLCRNRGVAMVYTHLDFNWLDIKSRSMCHLIRERLANLRELNGWFTVASNILDRFNSIKNIELVHPENSLTLINHGDEKVCSISLIVEDSDAVLGVRGQDTVADADNLVLIGDLQGNESLSITLAGR